MLEYHLTCFLHSVRESTGVLPPPDHSAGTEYLLDYLALLLLGFWRESATERALEKKTIFVGLVMVGKYLSCRCVQYHTFCFEVCGIPPSHQRDVLFYCSIFDVGPSTSGPGRFNGRSISVDLCPLLLWIVFTNVLHGNRSSRGVRLSCFSFNTWDACEDGWKLSQQGTAAWVWMGSGM